MTDSNLQKSTLLVIGALLLQVTASAEEVWTLENSVRQVIKVSPQIHSADAEANARKADLDQSRAWPNPDLGFEANEKMGVDDLTGGNDLTQIAVSQSIPLMRLPRESRQAEAMFRMQQALREETALQREYQAAASFSELQFTTSTLELATEILEFAKSYHKNSDGSQIKDPLVRYLTPLEEKRLDIIRATAEQTVASAEGEYAEKLSNFNALLLLSHDTESKVVPLEPVQQKETLEYLLAFQEKNHPAIAAFKHQEEAARAGVSIAYGELFPDPVISVYREKDILADTRQNFYGATLSFQVPVWDWKGGTIGKARANAEKAKYDLQALTQVLQAKLRESHMHLGHLIEQAEKYRVEILNPSKEVFELTRKGFSAGEVGVPSIIDANNIYLEARIRYLELLHEAWLESAEMRLAAGVSLVNDGGRS